MVDSEDSDERDRANGRFGHMRLIIRKKSELSETQLNALRSRLNTAKQRTEAGPAVVWDLYQQPDTLYAFVLPISGEVVGIAEASGAPEAFSAGWWIDPNFRGHGYGSELVDLLAAELKRRGFYGVGNLIVTSVDPCEYDRSVRLCQRLRQHFEGTAHP